VLADAAGLSINLDSDIGITEAMPIDGKVLSTVGVTLMSADIWDRWHIHGMVAFTHIVWAVSRFLFSYLGVTDLPQHFDGFFMTDWHVTYFSNNSVFIPVTEAVIIIYKELVVELRIANLGVNEDHLIRFQITNEI